MLLSSMYLFFIQCSLKAVQEEPLLLGVLRLDVVSDLSAWQLVLSILDKGFVFDDGVDFQLDLVLKIIKMLFKVFLLLL